MANGPVKWFSEAKGYGVITPDDGSKDLSVHHSSVAGGGFRSLSEGSRVEFDARESAKGPVAANVAAVA
jgi:CspA family cold shock protein